MTIYDGHMNESVTYWEPGTDDGAGGITLGTKHVDPLARWEVKNVLFRDVNGNEQVATDVVYINREVKRQGYLARGSEDFADATEIRQVNVSPSLGGRKSLVKAFL